MPENSPDEFVIDLHDVLNGLRRWLWLIVSGIILGTVLALVYSWLQTPVYQASTRIFLVVGAQNDQSTNIIASNLLIQLLQTNARTLSTPDFLKIVSQKMNYEVGSNDISVNVLQNTQVLELNVEDIDPKRAALIADTMVALLIEQDDKLQSAHDQILKADLNSQIKRIGNQRNSLQNKLAVEKQRALTDQLANTEKKILDARNELARLSAERDSLAFNPAPEAIARLSDVNARIDELQLIITSYETLYGELITTTEFQGEDPAVENLKQKVDLYQQLYLNLLTDLENINLTRLQNSPAIIQFGPTAVPVNPVRPKSGLNIGIGALAGLILSMFVIFFYELTHESVTSKDDHVDGNMQNDGAAKSRWLGKWFPFGNKKVQDPDLPISDETS